MGFLRTIALTLGAALALALPARAQPVNTGHIEAELVAQDQGVVPGGTTWLAIRQDIQKGWHTYWRNAGDAGEGTKLNWTLPQGWSAGDIVWPAPKRLLEGKSPAQLAVYAYEGEVLLPVPVEVPASARVGEIANLKVAAAFLVCAEICVPEDAVLTLSMPVVAGAPQPDPQWGKPIADTLAKAPKPAGLTAAFQRTGNALKLAVIGDPLKSANLSGAFFFPYSGTVIEHGAPEVIDRGPDGLTFTLTPGFAFTQGTAPAEIAGVLALKDAAYEVTAKAGPLP
ncbi:MAG: protein-disulfide reductase DsbD domain-containing protein, partial [Ignavibacteriales bacterium]